MRSTLIICLILAVTVLGNLQKRNAEIKAMELYESMVVQLPVPEVSVEILPYMEIDLRRISAYNPVARQTDGSPNISSCGPNLERQIAVSQDLFFDDNGRKHLCGVTVTVVTDRGEVFEDYVIWDTMNPRYTRTADILIPSTDEARAFRFGITPGTLYFYD